MGEDSHWQRRRTLPHAIPSWIHGDATYFVTVCARVRGANTLCIEPEATTLIASLRAHETATGWTPLACVLMPDHAHLLLLGRDPRTIVPPWKRYTARHLGIRWQRDFFEHRLRAHDAISAKVEYMRQNPVRAGLVATADAWPYIWVR
jgi:putative transposase